VLLIRDVYPGSRILTFIHSGSRILDPTISKEKGKTFLVLPFFVASNFTKIENYIIIEQVKKMSQFTKNFSVFLENFFTKLSKKGFAIRDPISYTRSWIPDP
jgi:hypothetical protein